MIILCLLAAALGTGLFTNLLLWTLGNPIEGPVKTGRMLSWIGERLRQRFLDAEKRIDEERVRRLSAEYEAAVEKHKQRAKIFRDLEPMQPVEKFKPKPYHPVNWWKLPICPRCLNVWHAIAGFVVFIAVAGISPNWAFAITLYMGFADAGCLISARLSA